MPAWRTAQSCVGEVLPEHRYSARRTIHWSPFEAEISVCNLSIHFFGHAAESLLQRVSIFRTDCPHTPIFIHACPTTVLFVFTCFMCCGVLESDSTTRLSAILRLFTLLSKSWRDLPYVHWQESFAEQSFKWMHARNLLSWNPWNHISLLVFGQEGLILLTLLDTFYSLKFACKLCFIVITCFKQ